MGKLEDIIENFIFSSRWLLVPIFVGLVCALFLLMVKFIFTFMAMVPTAVTMSFDDFAIAILNLLDFALLGCLVLLVIFSGYENFVSKINPAQDHKDRPSWMGNLDFSDLKLKISGSIVAISLIELLRDFLVLGSNFDPTFEFWRVTLHIVFVISGLLLACMVYVGEQRD